jgi:hypothetical protein
MSKQNVSGQSPIISVDLVKAALRSEELVGVPARQLERDVRDYERFLLLAAAMPGEPLAPTRAIDRMWHLHMLHPRAYARDCASLLGDILDHDGGFGTTEDEAPILARIFAQTASLWRAAYGEEYGGVGVKCTHDCVGRCWHACKTKVADLLRA